MKNKLPNFLIVGAAKSGTSSLHNYLNQHPEVFMPTFNKEGVNVKEPQFFVKQKVMNRIHSGIWDWENYKDLFKQAQSHQAIGEASVFYLYYFKEAIKNIKQYLNNEVKIIIILRNPINRAFSAHQHVSRSIKENLSFEDAIALEEERLMNNETLTPMVRYKDMGLYYTMVTAYLESFDNVHIILYDDFIKNTDNELKKVFRFLDVNENVEVDSEIKYNVGGVQWNNSVVKSILLNNSRLKTIVNKYFSKRIIANMWSFLYRLFKRKVLKMNPSTKEGLISFYKEDIIKLSKLINRDLTLWLR
jgi:hypothetical protein